MNTQGIQELLAPRDGNARTLSAGHALDLGHVGGNLDVLAGRVWLTRSGDIDDHVVEGGQSFRVPASGGTVIEAWSDERPALIEWRPRTLLERVVDGVRCAFARCWDLIDPARRIGIGSVAAVVALLVGAMVFGPLSDARARSLARPAVLHNSPAINASAQGAVEAHRGVQADAGARTRERARLTTQEARRGAPGAA